MCENCYDYCQNCGKLITGEDSSFCSHCRENRKAWSRWFVAS